MWANAVPVSIKNVLNLKIIHFFENSYLPNFKLELVSESPGRFVETSLAGLHPQNFRGSGSGVGPETAFSTGLQVMLIAGLRSALEDPQL